MRHCGLRPAIALPQHPVILNLFQDLTTGIEKEILNSRNFREPQRLTFQNDKKKIPLFFTFKKGPGFYRLGLSRPPLHMIIVLNYFPFADLSASSESTRKNTGVISSFVRSLPSLMFSSVKSSNLMLKSNDNCFAMDFAIFGQYG